MHFLELLAPAKNLHCGIEAIRHGADAVYIGAGRFGARAAAGNSIADIAELCKFAHIFGAKVYVTVNTLLFDDELPEAAALLQELKDVNVDAVLIQDLRLIDYAPDGLTLHASTQTDNRSVERVEEMARLGFERVVVAREMPLEDIKTVHKRLPHTEIECFVHGALCVSYSGACYASEYCFNRSANRGECAQFCRLPFDLVDAEGKTIIYSKHLLSLKDMCRIDSLEELADAGVCSFKIEGRLKDADYVKNVVAAYSQRLNKICEKSNGKYVRASKGRVEYAFRPDLRRTFNRGYTDYFLYGRKPAIENLITPKSVGMPVGKVKDRAKYWFSVATSEPFANGDGLCFIDDKKRMQGFRVNKVEGNRLFPQTMPDDLKKGTMLFRNHDEAFTKQLQGNTAERKLQVRMRLEVDADRITLFVTDRDKVEYTHPQPFPIAEKPQEENIVRNLTKLGNTPYSCSDVKIVWKDGQERFVPASVISRLRQQCFSQSPSPSPSQSQCQCQCQTPSPLPDGNDKPLMQCKHCIRYSLGYCPKQTSDRPSWTEPLSLKMSDGRRFRLQFDCKKCQMNVLAMFLCLFMLLLTGCGKSGSLPLMERDAGQSRYYGDSYNFIVKDDSMQLLRFLPSESSLFRDTLYVYKGDRVAVADILSSDSLQITNDTTWVQLMKDDTTFGWIEEMQMREQVVPADPISQGIAIFSDSHTPVFLVAIVAMLLIYLLRNRYKKGAPMVHFNDIKSAYPLALCLLVSSAATLYANIQMFDPEAWQRYYYNPTLNPLAEDGLIFWFLIVLWVIIIMAVASVSEVMKHLKAADAILYLCGLFAVCAADYIVFSQLTLFYVGYPLLLVYFFFAIRARMRS
ncbi:MAG: U32 family peptidase [Bacteroidaceae bacterium]|nr:U32 family peptidase [Bacteroidaceae bacterium]